MALYKKIEINNTGVFASYWKITTTNIDWANKKALIILLGFKNEKTRRNNKNAIITKTFEFTSSFFTFTFDGNILKEGYEAIKNHKTILPDEKEKESVFANAKDV